MSQLPQSEQEKALSLLMDVMRINTCNPPGGEEKLAEYIAAYLEKSGVSASVMPVSEGRANVTAVIKGKNPGNALLLNGHLDTVPFGESGRWNTLPGSPSVEGGRLYGRGSSDMKSGLCAMIYSFCVLARDGFVPEHDIIFAATADEESDGTGAQKLVDSGILDDVHKIIIGEPTGNAVGVASKGALWLEFTLKGKSSHGAYPWEGVNAVELGAGFAGKLRGVLGEAAHPYLTPPSLSLTMMNGGVKANMIPDECVMTFDIRTVPPQAHSSILMQIDELIRDFYGACPGLQIERRVLNDRMAVETGPDGALVCGLIESVNGTLGACPKLVGTGFFSDASVFLRNRDIPVVLFGPGESAEAHKPNESVSLEDYYDSALCYLRYLMTQ